jgi:hypothetical protein
MYNDKSKKTNLLFNFIHSLPLPLGVLISYLIKRNIDIFTVSMSAGMGYLLIGGLLLLTNKRKNKLNKNTKEN